jgi:hypothetical protein
MKSKTLSQKYLPQKRAGRVAQVVEHLPSKCKNLNSNPGITQKKGPKKHSSPHVHACLTQTKAPRGCVLHILVKP